MPRFFTEPPQGQLARLTGEDARHVARVLRMREGESITLCDGAGTDYHGEIAAILPDEVTVRVVRSESSASEPAARIRLYQALPKGDKMDWIVQKAVELGTAEIVPVLSERCVSRPDAKSLDRKIARWNKIALEAAKQAGRGAVPQVLPLETFAQALCGMKQGARSILLYERAVEPMSAFLVGVFADISLMVGSEGGFSEEEAQQAREQGVALASLGRRILRCETAPLCALTAVLYSMGEL